MNRSTQLLFDYVLRDRVSMILFKMEVGNIYPENVWVKVGKRASSVMGVTEAEFFTGVGTSFVQFVTSYGFDKLTGSIARNYRDFVQVVFSPI